MSADPLQITIWPPPPSPRILDVGAARLDQRWTCELHAPFWRIYHHQGSDGEIQLSGPGIQHRLPLGRVAIIPPRSTLRGTCRGIVDQAFLNVDPVLPEWWLRLHPPDVHVLVANQAHDAVFDRLRASPIGVVPATLRLALAATVAACLEELVQALPEAQRASLDEALAAQDALAPALNEIAANPAGRIDLEVLAARCGLSRRQFSRLFRERLHASPEQWRQRQRITAAADRLAGSNETIDVIAAEAGFTDRFHFSRVFSKVLGDSPAAWRARRQVARLYTMSMP